MKKLYVRPLTESEIHALEQCLRSTVAFTVRRCQILLKSGRDRLSAAQIATHLYCSDQTAREAIHTFHEQGLACVEEGSHVPYHLETAFDESGANCLKETVHQSPRQFGLKRSLWGLEDLAQLAYEQGYTDRVVAPAVLAP